MTKFGTFCVHLVHFVFIWYILCSFGTFCVHLVHFSNFGIMDQEKSGNIVYMNEAVDTNMTFC
jgi:hypothetical protein